ncbi:MAG: response regulator, partial [Cyanobacteria bacterium J06643_4]
QDTGVGMTQEQLQRAFNPFEQVGDVRKRSEGTGLGLAISQRIVSMMGGELMVESTVGQGSIFWFDVVLRLVDAPTGASRQRSHSRRILGYHGARKRILVVDDSWENRSVMMNFLQPLGFEMREADSGLDALATIETWPPDMVITDLSMPGMDGITLLEQIKVAQMKEKTALVSVISSANVSMMAMGDRLQETGYILLPKPIQANDLFDMLQAQLSISWIYGEPINTGYAAPIPTSPSNSTIAYPSVDVLKALEQLADSGDIYGLSAQVKKQLANTDEFTPFFQQLATLAEDFQIRPIMRFIQRGLDLTRSKDE